MFVVLIISFIPAILLVNFGYKLFMRILDADGMFFNAKVKIILYVVVALLICTGICTLFGIT